ncbi:MAG: extracellular solute-binding protein [Oscillospiraceae bacterium]|jgi:ABC-type glycerol-3-phosphate transport system substrate-binding protein|nr:extracellular solute-binding protein [Oscillospiraceae bacterium]
MIWKRGVGRAVAVSTAVALFLALPAYGYTAGDKTRADFEDIIEGHSIDESIPSYRDYITLHPLIRPDVRIAYDAAAYARYEESGEAASPQILADIDGTGRGGVLTTEDSLIEFEIDVPETGLYDLSVLYYPIEGKNSTIQRGIFVNGELPYRELSTIEFQRIWSNRAALAAAEAGSLEPVWNKDNQGNDLKPSMVECPQWVESYLYDSDGYITSRLSLYLEKGKQTVSLLSLREPMLLSSLIVSNEPYPVPYAEALAGWVQAGAKDATQSITIQAQNASRTSSQMLYPVQDQSSPSVSPSSPRVLLNNTIGGYSWRTSGQWIEWDFYAPEDGLYELSVHVLQNFTRGIYMSRKISIDGVVPFAEFDDYGFTHRQTWNMETLTGADGEVYKIYLTEGRHTLRMEAVLGSLGEAIGLVRDAVYDLNSIYRKVIRLTGVKPDQHRDYQVERSLPELRGEMIAVRDSLEEAVAMLEGAAGRRSDRERVLKTMITHLNELIADGERFSRTVASFRINIRACGTWLTQAIEQPLQIDTITFHSPDERPRAKSNSFFARLGFEFQRLFFSFIIDYNQIGNISDSKDGDTITLWIGSGRDQANVIKSLIDETFTGPTGVNINVMLVDMSTLLQATLAGQGPDVAIQVPFDVPMNYGLRNAVADLTQFSDLNGVLERFRPSIMESYSYGGAVYALPETQTFPMMFYRKDILKEIGLEIPRTWDDMKVALAVLANSQMELGMLPAEPIYAMLLYQNGGNYYNEDATRSALDNDEGYRAFKQYTEFYTDYKLDKDTSVEERFRTGETPLIIQDYGFYNALQVSAPDIKGLWGFTPVPATVWPDGSLNREVGSWGSACVIMRASELPEQSWEFLKWWTSANTQTMFGREMESLMGAAARHPSANIEAFDRLPWPINDYQALQEQFETVRGIPQVPGGYFSFRNIRNAFYAVVTGRSAIGASVDVFEFPREALTDKVILINDEIDFKRREFGLPLYGDREGD